MNGVRLLSSTLFTLNNFSFFSLHYPLFSLRIFSKNGYLKTRESWANVLAVTCSLTLQLLLTDKRIAPLSK